MNTYQPTKKDMTKNWHLIDAKGQILGRLATQIAKHLTGKNKVNFSQHADMGDYVVVVNAKEIVLTGRKNEQKTYKSHSGYPGGLRLVKFAQMMNRNPEKVIELAVSGMIPDNRLKRERMKRLRVFAGEKHSHQDKFKNQKEK